MMPNQSFLLVLVWSLVILHSNAQIPEAPKREDYRLPKYIEPIEYEIDLTIKRDFFQNPLFYGETIIYFNCTEKYTAGAPVILNAHNINITQALLNDKDVDPKINETLQRLVINDTQLTVGNQTHKLKLTYRGIIGNDPEGLFMGSYKEDGETRWFLATHLEPTYARRIFPCLDEPAFKAIFKITVTHPKDYVVRSNTDSIAVSVDSGKSLKTSFKPTPKMSTYLVALLISKFAHITEKHNGITYSLWYPPKLDKMYQLALNVTPRIVEMLENTMGVTYLQATNNKIVKVDQVALPHGMGTAMENWGLIIFQNPFLLLWNERHSTGTSRLMVINTIAHELSHVWFGNLKTCNWWNIAWLNEGFASYFANVITTKLQANFMTQSIAETLSGLMQMDSLTNDDIAPLTSPEDDFLTTQKIMQNFGVISYNKGGNIIRMMAMIMGDSIFISGIRMYMKKGHFETVTPKDLWDSWNDVSELKNILPKGVSLETVMKEWTESKGYPVVSVTRNGNQVELSAKRFTHQLSDRKSIESSIWYIPIAYASSNKPTEIMKVNKDRWINKTTTLTLEEDLSAARAWIVVNPDFNAYIRVNYDSNLWKALQTALKKNHGQFSALTRARIIDDALELALLGELKYTLALDVIQYLRNELDVYPWKSAIAAFKTLQNKLSDNGRDLADLHKFIRPLFLRYYKAASKAGTHEEKLKMEVAKQFGCEIGYTDCTKSMIRMFTDFVKNNKEIEPDLRSTAYCVGMKKIGGKKHWDILFKRLGETVVPSEVPILIDALACVEDKVLLKAYLRKMLEPSPIEASPSILVFKAVATGSRVGLNLALDFLIENIKEILHHYENATYSFLTLLEVLKTTIRTKEQLQKLEELAKKPEVAQISPILHMVISSIQTQMTWNEERRKSFLSAMRSRIPRTTRGRSTAAVFSFNEALVLIPIIINIFGYQVI